jgi:hypothetical protein
MQAVVLAILRSGEIINLNTDADDLAEQGAGARGADFDGFVPDTGAREKGERADREECNDHKTANDRLMLGKRDSV